MRKDERENLKAHIEITESLPGSVVKYHLSLVAGNADQGSVPQPIGHGQEKVIAIYPLKQFPAAYNRVRKQVPMDSDTN